MSNPRCDGDRSKVFLFVSKLRSGRLVLKGYKHTRQGYELTRYCTSHTDNLFRSSTRYLRIELMNIFNGNHCTLELLPKQPLKCRLKSESHCSALKRQLFAASPSLHLSFILLHLACKKTPAELTNWGEQAPKSSMG